VSSGRSKKELCNVCKDFIKKFEDGMKKTEGKNFGGGDTDWEEKKLGSFAKSETRLVEILETVCEDVSPKHACNGMVEDHEEEIEHWWFKIHGEMDEFEKYLCYDELKVCCPKGHYGKKCKECTGGAENPCNGKGTCSGDGWRGGNGKCKCDEGYEGDVCEKCQEGFVRNETNSNCEKPKEEEDEDEEEKEDMEKGDLSPENETVLTDDTPKDEVPPKDEVSLEAESSPQDTLPPEPTNGTPSEEDQLTGSSTGDIPSQNSWNFDSHSGGSDEL